MVKALALGARAVGVAGVFLQAALADGADTLVPLIRGWLDQTAALCALLGVTEPAGLTSTDVLVRGRLGEFCMLRGVDAPALSQRSRTRRKP